MSQSLAPKAKKTPTILRSNPVLTRLSKVTDRTDTNAAT